MGAAGDWVPNLPTSLLWRFVSQVNVRDGASGLSACDQRFDPHFIRIAQPAGGAADGRVAAHASNLDSLTTRIRAGAGGW